MPHVIVKMLSGRSEEEKSLLAMEITKVVVAVLGSEEKAVSVSIEDVERQDWTDKVYQVDIMANRDRVYKMPGYEPL